jgi:RNA polymerase sigma-70 factor (ECF subfamily)
MHMMDHDPDEYELACRARDGDREALSDLVERERLRLFALAYAELRHYDDAQDVVAAALLRICRHVGGLREPARARAWMQSVVRNEARRRLASRAGEPAPLLETAPVPGADGGPSLLRLDVQLALRRLPRDQALALAFFYLDQLPIDEIARQTGRPEGTIKRWLHLGRRRLATEMEEYAPMAPTSKTTPTPVPIRAAIISSEFDAERLQEMKEALSSAGFTEVATFDDMARLVQRPRAKKSRYRVAPQLRGAKLIVLDEWLRGRSAFEILAILKAAPELEGARFFLFADTPRDETVYAAWCAGVDCFLTKPFEMEEFANFSRRLFAAATAGQPLVCAAEKAG